MLSERQKLVLIAIIEEYVKTNEPVGSFALSKRPELNFSTATLRNEMAQLEEMGFLEKTHTSSGRIPSEKGYRFYVETIMRKSNEKDANFPMIDEIFERPNVTREEAITESMDIVTELTNYATIALGKTSYNSRIKKLEFVSLKENYAVILMVTDQGHVESKRIMVPTGISIREIERTISILDEVLHNCLFSDIQNQLLDDITNDEIRDYIHYHSDLVDAIVNAFAEMAVDKYHISGQYNLLSQPEFQDVRK
ncbi:MAG: heat-inducible transcriptional repressor HrcA [Bacilli bacterium]